CSIMQYLPLYIYVVPVLSLLICPPPASTLFPYTTLFRSRPVRTMGDEPRVVQGGAPHGHHLERRSHPRAAALQSLSRHVPGDVQDRKSTRLNSSHLGISYAVFCLKKKKTKQSRMMRDIPN